MLKIKNLTKITCLSVNNQYMLKKILFIIVTKNISFLGISIPNSGVEEYRKYYKILLKTFLKPCRLSGNIQSWKIRCNIG